MTTDQLDAVHRAQPFRPFTLHLTDGSEHAVAHPELRWRTPGGRTIVLSLGGEKMVIIELLLVTKITHGNGVRRRRRRQE